MSWEEFVHKERVRKGRPLTFNELIELAYDYDSRRLADEE